MDNLYSKFYTGRTNPFGIGTWDSNFRRRLNHSSSQPNFLSQKSSNSKNLILPPVSNKYDNGARKSKQYPTQSSSSISTYNYDPTRNRKELSNYIKDINYNVANKLQNDNFIAQQKLNNLKNNYNEIKTLLNNKLEKLEHEQQMQFDNLKYALEQGGNLKMMGAVKNANGGNKYDLQRAEEEDIIDATRKLPRILDQKLNEAFGNRRNNNIYGNNRIFSNMTNMRRRVDDELQRQRDIDDMKFKQELDEIEAKRENMRRERKRMLQELQNQEIDELDDPLYLTPPPLPFYQNPYNPYNPYMMPPPYFMPPYNNNNNSNHDSTGDLIKIFLIKKLFDDNKPSQQQQFPQYPYQYYPFMMPPQNNTGNSKQPSINYPQPIILQSPQYPIQKPLIVDGPNKDKEDNDSQKGIPFVDPLEKYLEMVNKAKITSKNNSEKSNAKLKKKTGDEDDEENEDGEGGEEDGEGGGEGGEEDGEGGGEDGEGGGEGGEEDGEGGGEGGEGEGDGGEDAGEE